MLIQGIEQNTTWDALSPPQGLKVEWLPPLAENMDIDPPLGPAASTITSWADRIQQPPKNSLQSFMSWHVFAHSWTCVQDSLQTLTPRHTDHNPLTLKLPHKYCSNFVDLELD